MKIERATMNDLAELMRVCVAFFNESPFGALMPRDEAAHKQAFDKIASLVTDGIVFVARDDTGVHGAIGGHLVPFWWNEDVQILADAFWYVMPEKRGGTAGVRLLDEFEKEGVRRGASWATIQAGLSRSVAPILQRRGYQVQGPVCMKVLPCLQP